MIKSRKKQILKLIEAGDSKRLFGLLEELRGVYAVYFILNALSENEITEHGAAVFNLLKEQLDPRGKEIDLKE